jgi:hypothetical protein
MNDSVEYLANKINAIVPNIKAGSLRFFGVWFGKPYDNYHRIIKAEAKDSILLITFNENEVLEVTEPQDCVCSLEEFEIKCAKRVIGKWYYYGRSQTNDDLFSYNFEFNGVNVLMSTDANWCVERQVALSTEPAVKIY